MKDNPRYPYKPNVPLTIVVNPVITPLADEKFENYEGCPSGRNRAGRRALAGAGSAGWEARERPSTAWRAGYGEAFARETPRRDALRRAG